MDNHGVGRGTGSLPAGEDVLHVVGGEVHLVVTAVNEFGKADVELGNVAFPAFQNEFVTPCNYLQMREVRAELGEYFVAHAIDFYGVDGFQRDGFLHTKGKYTTYIWLFFGKKLKFVDYGGLDYEKEPHYTFGADYVRKQL